MPINASIYAVAAMCGCMRWESSLNPKVWESGVVADWDTIWHRNEQGWGVGGFGLGQWTNTREADGIAWRLRDFHDWCVANNLDIYSGSTQLQYIMYEDVWFNVSHIGSNAQSLTEFLETDSTNLNGLVADFLANWEGVPNDHLSERQQYAAEFLTYIREHKDDDPSTISWESSNNYILPVSETFNNSLCFYFYFNGYDPGPGPSFRKGMPLWMMLRRYPF